VTGALRVSVARSVLAHMHGLGQVYMGMQSEPVGLAQPRHSPLLSGSGLAWHNVQGRTLGHGWVRHGP